MIEQNETLVDRLRVLKDKSGMTTMQIAEKSKVPESTVARIFAGKTPNPTIITVIAMTKAMGGSAADIFDDDAQVNPTTALPLTEAERYHSEIVRLYQEIIRARMQMIKALGLTLIVVVAVILIVLIFDIFNGGIGFFRYN